MDRRERNETSKLEVAAAKARLRVAAASVRPGRALARNVRLSPWMSVGVALALGLLVGAVPRSRKALPGLAAALLRRVG